MYHTFRKYIILLNISFVNKLFVHFNKFDRHNSGVVVF
jgi:hypothetical protein